MPENPTGDLRAQSTLYHDVLNETPDEPKKVKFDYESALKAGYSMAEIADDFGKASGFKVKEARAAGYSDEEIVKDIHAVGNEGFIKKTARLVYDNNPLLTGGVKRGVAKAINSTANTAEELGAPGAAATIRSAVDTQALHSDVDKTGRGINGVAGVMQGLKDGSVTGVLANVPGAVMEGVPMVGATAGAMAAGTAAGGPAGGLLAGGLVAGGLGAATSGGDIARARAANDGRTETNATDIALGLAGGAGLGVLGNVPGLAPGRGVVQALLAGGKQIAGDAAQALGTQVLSSTGTEKGTQLDPYEIGTQAITGGATRGALGATRKVRTALGAETEGTKNARLQADYAELTPEQIQRGERVAAAAKTIEGTTADAVPGPGETRVQAAARTSLRDLSKAVHEVLNNHDVPTDVRKVIDGVMSEARSSQGVLTESHLQSIRDLSLNPELKKVLVDTAQQFDLLSDAGVANRGAANLLAKTTGVLGAIGGAALGAKGFGHPVLGGRAGYEAGSKVGNNLAARFGLTEPNLIKEAKVASAMMEAVGHEIPNTRAQLDEALVTSKDVYKNQMDLMKADAEKARTQSEADRVASDRAAALRADNRGRDNAERAGAWMEKSLIRQGKATVREAEAAASDRARAAADFAKTSERDQTAIDRDTATTADAVEAQRAAAYQEVSRQNAEARAKAMGNEASYAGMERIKAAQEEALFAMQKKEGTQTARRTSETSARALKVALDQSRAHFAEANKQTPEGANAPYAEGNPVSPETAGDLLKSTDRSGAILDRVAAEQTPPPGAPQARPAAPGVPPAVVPPPPPLGAPGDPYRSGGRDSINGPDGLTPEQLALTTRIKDWKWGMADSVARTLQQAGLDSNINFAAEVNRSVREMTQQGLLTKEFSDLAMNHRGHMHMTYWNMIRNHILMRKGVNRLDHNNEE